MNDRPPVLLEQATIADESVEALDAGHATDGQATLRETVALTMQRYFEHLDGESVTDLYQMVLSEVEAPLLASVMAHVNDNQTAASQLLGLNRGTLRKKLKQHGLL
ncbi:DNA-binding transcriptional regulator Fis [Halotalea alkalilenta]|uniref:DNA-binding transcriptional regulator Fis n=1 Tax=Halotalea alkalilenta TaxID=376489 RepID=UPI0009EE3DC4|nr:DNA-binding transcriptional regulator Fis [Halotalea alkalilenta]